ncbi:toxin glutamine deamidase domain-containing protein [Lactobacillus crispatus]|uniref:toxin glutamine deamidase domain-containing protein n=1 Tax=Lactobacillus crispatus TaxID=47770 RepID=UPI0018AC07CC|nr:toxin glutamine deamidase domain-containing protein [Lactobacillus crispatus]
MTTKKNNYWAERERAERAWQIEQDKNFDKYVKELGEIYQKAIDNINREIRADIGIANGQLIKADKMAEYERLAKAMVKKADAMRAKGHTVTRKDFSKDVNDRLKIYNATMRVNRNEILKSMIGEQLVDLGIEQEVDLTKKLWNDYTKEKERQAGILGVTTKNKTWSNTDTAEIIYGQIANANFSKRIWANVDSLKGRLDGLVSTAIIRGDNPKEMAKWLTGEVGATIKSQRYVAERLARSETARVQFSVQKMSALQNGYKYVKWYVEGSACKACKAIAGDDVGYGDGIYPVKEVPDIPVHPNCMCSIGAYWVEDDKKPDEISPKYLNYDGITLGKPMSIEEADRTNANMKYYGLTPKVQANNISRKKEMAELIPWIDKNNHFGIDKETHDELVKKINRYNSLLKSFNNSTRKVRDYHINCQRCAPAYELRRRGYNVEALPNPHSDYETTYLIPKNMWRNKDGSVAKAKLLDASNNKEVDDELDKLMSVGERGTIDWCWARQRVGHIINVEKTKNGLRFIDAQSGKIEKSFENYMGKNKFRLTFYGNETGVKYNRTDDKSFDLESIDKVVKAHD